MDKLEERFYEQATNEARERNVVTGVMGKALSDAMGDKEKAIAFYIKYRVAQLKREHEKNAALQAELMRKKETARLKSVVAETISYVVNIILGLIGLLFSPMAVIFVCVGITDAVKLKKLDDMMVQNDFIFALTFILIGFGSLWILHLRQCNHAKTTKKIDAQRLKNE